MKPCSNWSKPSWERFSQLKSATKRSIWPMRHLGQWSRCLQHSLTCLLNMSKKLLRFSLDMHWPNIRKRPWKGSSNISSSHGLVWEGMMVDASNWSFGMSEIGNVFLFLFVLCAPFFFFFDLRRVKKYFFWPDFKLLFPFYTGWYVNKKKERQTLVCFFVFDRDFSLWS